MDLNRDPEQARYPAPAPEFVIPPVDPPDDPDGTAEEISRMISEGCPNCQD